MLNLHPDCRITGPPVCPTGSSEGAGSPRVIQHRHSVITPGLRSQAAHVPITASRIKSHPQRHCVVSRRLSTDNLSDLAIVLCLNTLMMRKLRTEDVPRYSRAAPPVTLRIEAYCAEDVGVWGTRQALFIKTWGHFNINPHCAQHSPEGT